MATVFQHKAAQLERVLYLAMQHGIRTDDTGVNLVGKKRLQDDLARFILICYTSMPALSRAPRSYLVFLNDIIETAKKALEALNQEDTNSSEVFDLLLCAKQRLSSQARPGTVQLN